MDESTLGITNHDLGQKGELIAKKFFEKLGYTVYNRERTDKGFDLKIEKDGVKSTVEVKTTKNQKGGIPDIHHNEFTQKEDGLWYLTADYLCIIRTVDGEVNQIDLLTKKEVDEFASTIRTKIMIQTTSLDTALRNKKTGKFYDQDFNLIDNKEN